MKHTERMLVQRGLFLSFPFLHSQKQADTQQLQPPLSLPLLRGVNGRAIKRRTTEILASILGVLMTLDMRGHKSE